MHELVSDLHMIHSRTIYAKVPHRMNESESVWGHNRPSGLFFGLLYLMLLFSSAYLDE